jgi:uncharacterized protein YndB with AHSA1/START domain
MSRTLRTEVELDAPPEKVWEVVVDPHRLEQWVTTHSALGAGAPRELEQGSSFEQKLRLGGRPFKVTWTVTDCERPRNVSWSGDGPAGSRARVRYTLEPLDGGRTRFGYENEFELPGGPLGRLAGRAVGDRLARREAERSLANLKALVEA